MGVKMVGDWKLALKLFAQAPARFAPAASKALMREALYAQRLIKKNITSAKPAQSPLTEATGGGGKPLIRSGDLLGSVNILRKAPLLVFIGIPRTDGSYNIGMIQEEGSVTVQPKTPRMLAFLHAKLKKVGDPPIRESRVIVSQIPARPFVAPAMLTIRAGFDKRFGRSFSKALKGDYGKL